MIRSASFCALVLLGFGALEGGLGLVPSSVKNGRRTTACAAAALNRQEFGAQILALAVPATLGVLAFPDVARADVSDGTSLPQGAQQFARVLRLKTDIQVRNKLPEPQPKRHVLCRSPATWVRPVSSWDGTCVNSISRPQATQHAFSCTLRA